jgi:hypothetical protein
MCLKDSIVPLSLQNGESGTSASRRISPEMEMLKALVEALIAA